MARGAVLHIARLSRTVPVQARAIAPFTVELDPVRRVGDEQLPSASPCREQVRDNICGFVRSPQISR